MKSYCYYLNPRSCLTTIAGVFAVLMSANFLYCLYSVTYYSQSFDHWLEFAAALLMAVCCFGLAKRHTAFLALPSAMFAFVASLTHTVAHWMIMVLFLLLFMLIMLRLPKAVVYALRVVGIGCAAVGVYQALSPMVNRIQHYMDTGNATANYVIPLVIRTIGGDVLCILLLLLLLFAMKPRELPGWQDDEDRYDRIWE